MNLPKFVYYLSIRLFLLLEMNVIDLLHILSHFFRSLSQQCLLRHIFERFFQTIVPIHNVIHNILHYFIHLLVFSIESNYLRKV